MDSYQIYKNADRLVQHYGTNDPIELCDDIGIMLRDIILESDAPKEEFMQLDLFADAEKIQAEQVQETISEEKERSIQQAMLDIKKKFGKNAILKGMNLSEGATTIERNGQVGGHRA